MPNFIMLANFTDQGVRTAKETTKRYDAFKEMAQKSGVTIKDIYWTLGHVDVVAICEAADDETVSAAVFSLASRGNIRTQTLRAFSRAEMDAIINKMT
jgi:uncharacterized protein with GYD domain